MKIFDFHIGDFVAGGSCLRATMVGNFVSDGRRFAPMVGFAGACSAWGGFEL